MTYPLGTLTLLTREIEALTDRLDLLQLGLSTGVPHPLRHLPRDLASARDALDITLMDLRDAIADETEALAASQARHPSGRALAVVPDDADELADEMSADEPTGPEVSEFADLAVAALTADPERTRAVLRDIADAGVVAAPGETTTAGPEDQAAPPAPPVESEPGPVAEVTPADADALAGRPPAWWVEGTDEDPATEYERNAPEVAEDAGPGGRHRKPEDDQ